MAKQEQLSHDEAEQEAFEMKEQISSGKAGDYYWAEGNVTREKAEAEVEKNKPYNEKESIEHAKEKIIDIFAERNIYLHGISTVHFTGKYTSIFEDGILSSSAYREKHHEELPETYWHKRPGEMADDVICVADLGGDESRVLTQIKSLEILRENLDQFFLPKNERTNDIHFKGAERFIYGVFPVFEHNDYKPEIYQSDDFKKLRILYDQLLNNDPNSLKNSETLEFFSRHYQLDFSEEETKSIKEKVIETASQLIMNCLELLKKEYERCLQESQRKQKVLPSTYFPPILIIRSDEVPLYYSGAGDYDDLQIPFRIKPENIIGVLTDSLTAPSADEVRLAKTYSLPLYGTKGNLVWPEKKSHKKIAEELKRKPEKK